MTCHWQLDPVCSAQEATTFADLDAIFSLTGEAVTASPLSDVVRLELDDRQYYVKRYRRAGKHLQAWIGPPRVEMEWTNLQRFAAWGIPTARVVAYGQERRWGRFVRGAMVTEALQNTTDLADLARTGDTRLRDSAWVRNVSHQLAMITHTLHAHRFAHNDLKWRNVLVDTDSHVFLIDCPLGRHLHQPFLEPRKRKDLATLDKVAKQALRGSQRLRFFLDYLGKTSLDAADKRSLRIVLRYFEGRE